MSVGGTIASGPFESATPGKKSIFGVAITDMPRDVALQRLLQALQAHQPMKLAFCNAHTANLAWSSPEVRETLKAFTIFADGIGVDIAAKALHGARFAANLNGTDFVPALLQAEPRSLTIALFGAAPGVAEKAASAITSFAPQHHVAAIQHGFGDAVAMQAFLDQLSQAPVDILLVAMGNPKQEEFIATRVSGHHATLAIGVGALFDFLAGEVHRAPLWIQHLRLEWLYRLAQEPQRLFRRYVLGNPLFLLRIGMVKLGLRRF
jgi:exopolysaccharide biosynthesis WecB/TagA/CpsF family protein